MLGMCVHTLVLKRCDKFCQHLVVACMIISYKVTGMGDSAHNVQRGHTACLLIIYVMCSRYFAEVSQFEFQSIFLSCKTCIHIGTVAGAGRLRTQWLRRPVHTAILSSPWCNPCDHHLCPGISKLSLFAYNPSSSPSLALFGPNIEPLRLSGTCPHLRGRNVKYVFFRVFMHSNFDNRNQ